MTKLRLFSKSTGKPTRALPPNTFQARSKHSVRKVFSVFFLIAATALCGCGPKYSYPASTVSRSVEDICKNENKLTVQARLVGKTLGALLYVDQLVDDTGQMPKEMHEQMGKVLQAVTRVGLSTDASIDFCSVIIRDKTQGNELTVTRSMDDTKRANADALGVEESINRTLFTQGRYLKDALGNIPFGLKDVKLESFLAEQIVQRIRYGFAREAQDPKKAKDKKKADPDKEAEMATGFVLVDGSFERVQDQNGFKFSILSMKSDDPKKTMLAVFKTVNDVLAGYRFSNFDKIEIQDYLNRQKLIVDRETFLNYQNKKIKDKEILDRFLEESQSVQEAFKLFGFNLPADSSENQDASLMPSKV